MNLDFMTQALQIEVIPILIAALTVNISTMGFKEMLFVFRKAVNQVNWIPIEFQKVEVEITYVNVVIGAILSWLSAFVTLKTKGAPFTWGFVFVMALPIWLASFVTWKVGLKDTVALIPAALAAGRRKLDSIAPKGDVAKPAGPSEDQAVDLGPRPADPSAQ
jgi:hypothetical protein